MKANEARELSIKAVSSEIKDIEREIIEATKLGENSVRIMATKSAVLAHFKDNGYEIEQINTGIGGIISYIKW